MVELAVVEEIIVRRYQVLLLLLPLLLVRLVLVEMVVTPGIQELLVLLLKRVRRRRREMLQLLLLLLGVMVEDGLVVPNLLLIHIARAGEEILSVYRYASRMFRNCDSKTIFIPRFERLPIHAQDSREEKRGQAGKREVRKVSTF